MKFLIVLCLLSAVFTAPFLSARAQVRVQGGAPQPTPQPTASRGEPREVGDDDVLTVNTSLVSVPVFVKDQAGGYVVDLKQEDFHVYEGVVEQRIAYFGGVEEPISVVLLVDVSCSIEKPDDTKAALLSFVDQLRPADTVLPIAFGKNIYALLTTGTNDRAVLRERILGMPDGKGIPCDNGTRLFDAVDFVIRHVVKTRAGRGAVILLSDGRDSQLSKTGSFTLTQRNASQLRVPIYSLRLERKFNPREGIFSGFPNDPLAERTKHDFFARDIEGYIENLARLSGGRYFPPAQGAELKKSLTQIGEELRHQYTLAYYPPAAPKSAPQRRKIKVRVDRKRVSVLARDSYVYLPSGK
jgi:VWFA-related protein